MNWMQPVSFSINAIYFLGCVLAYPVIAPNASAQKSPTPASVPHFVPKSDRTKSEFEVALVVFKQDKQDNFPCGERPPISLAALLLDPSRRELPRVELQKLGQIMAKGVREFRVELYSGSAFAIAPDGSMEELPPKVAGRFWERANATGSFCLQHQNETTRFKTPVRVAP